MNSNYYLPSSRLTGYFQNYDTKIIYWHYLQPFFKTACPVLYNQNIQPSFLRKLTAILLVITFAISQYAKQASYLECVLFNYFKAPAQLCDCMKIISESKAATDHSPVPSAHNHLHIDESYLLPFSITRLRYYGDGVITSFLTTISQLEDGVENKQYRPPRLIE